MEIWIEEQKDSVLFYKKQGESALNSDTKLEKEDFCLIIMNSSQEFMLKNFGQNVIAIDNTHGLNPYDFELTTLVVLDEYGEGFPSACMFSNRKDTYIYFLFFSLIEQKCGKINSNVFMSDITDVYYNAWISTMGIPTFKLYCSWHVDRAWKTNLNKIKNTEKKGWVYKTVKYLQTSLDADAFKNDLFRAINIFKEDKDTYEFGCYFETRYSVNVKMWAYCFRKSCGINTNMHVESMHKIIKYFYLQGKSVQRLDKGLHAVLNFIRDKTVERIIKNTKGKNNYHIQQILKRHRTSITSNFQLNMLNNEFEVTSQNDKIYFVKEKCRTKCCELACQYCNICIHSYTCDCADFFIHNTICKHIHFVAFQHADNNQNHNNYTEHDNEHEISVHLNCLNNKTKETSVSNLKTNIQNKIATITEECNNISDMTGLHEINNGLNQTISNIQIWKVNEDIEKNIPARKQLFESSNKNIDKQVSFFSTRKRKKVDKNKLQIKKPSFEEIEDIRAILFQ